MNNSLHQIDDAEETPRRQPSRLQVTYLLQKQADSLQPL